MRKNYEEIHGRAVFNRDELKEQQLRMNDTEIRQQIEAARRGDDRCLGALLDANRAYLQVLVGAQIGRNLRGKVDASDIIQETFLEAHRGMERFQGETEPQFLAWLKSILAAKLANVYRHYLGTQLRDVRLEQQCERDLEHSSMSLAGLIQDPHSSPSQQLQRGEQARMVVDALSRLPEDYQQVLILRHMEGLTFPQIAETMGRSLDSVEKLWVRGLGRLRKEFVQSSQTKEGRA